MERPEFGLVGSLSRLVDEERACGGVEQGLLRTSRGKSQTFSTDLLDGRSLRVAAPGER